MTATPPRRSDAEINNARSLSPVADPGTGGRWDDPFSLVSVALCPFPVLPSAP